MVGGVYSLPPPPRPTFLPPFPPPPHRRRAMCRASAGGRQFYREIRLNERSNRTVERESESEIYILSNGGRLRDDWFHSFSINSQSAAGKVAAAIEIELKIMTKR